MGVVTGRLWTECPGSSKTQNNCLRVTVMVATKEETTWFTHSPPSPCNPTRLGRFSRPPLHLSSGTPSWGQFMRHCTVRDWLGWTKPQNSNFFVSELGTSGLREMGLAYGTYGDRIRTPDFQSKTFSSIPLIWTSELGKGWQWCGPDLAICYLWSCWEKWGRRGDGLPTPSGCPTLEFISSH